MKVIAGNRQPQEKSKYSRTKPSTKFLWGFCIASIVVLIAAAIILGTSLG